MSAHIQEFSVRQLLLFITVLFSGFFGGIGFFTIIGHNPALDQLSDAGFAEYWQYLDHYMAARMKIFGPLLLLFLICSCAMLFRQEKFISSGLMLAALLLVVLDVVVALNFTHPLNVIIQNWNLESLPVDVAQVKDKLINAFWVRSISMITSFIMALLAYWRQL